jgi:tRNA nucleotidyltransferase (CCA-adding enzyme)
MHLHNTLLDAKVVEIIKHLPQGARGLIVGGAVRDMLLDIETKDLDIEIHGLNYQELKKLLAKYGPVREVGKSFGVLKVDGINADWSLPRKDSSGRRPVVEIDPQMDLKDAFLRRDLTINALGYDPKTQEIIDFYGGMKDIKNKTLKAVSIQKFGEDPLRVLRVMQFMSRFSFTPDKDLTDLCKTVDLSGLSVMRIRVEFSKLLAAQNTSLGLRWLDQIGQLGFVMPEFKLLFSSKKVQDLAFASLDEAANITKNFPVEQRQIIMWASFLGASGTQIKATNLVDYHNEIKNFATYFKLVKNCLTRLSGKKILIEYVLKLVTYVHTIDFLSHQDVLDYDLYKLSVLLSPASINDLLLCYQALNKFSNDNNLPTKMMAFNFLRDRCKQLDILAKQPEPLITGKYLFDLGCQDLKLGNMLKHAYDLQLKGFSRADIIKALGIFSK